MPSILTSVKKMLGIGEDYTHFDPDITMHINSVLPILTQIGIGPTTGFLITDKSDLWTDFINDETRLALVKSYMYLKVKLIFDPPLSSSLIDAMKRSIDEFEWRILVTAEQLSAEEEEIQNE